MSGVTVTSGGSVTSGTTSGNVFTISGTYVSGGAGVAPPINAIFTLDSQSLLTNPVDILSYVLRYYCTAPKSVSNSTFKYMISLTDTISRYQDNSNTMTQQVTNDLSGVYNRYFPAGATMVNVTANDNGNGSYNITIATSVTMNGNNYTLGADVTVNNTGVLQLKWHPQLN